MAASSWRVGIWAALCLPASASHLVTGNGYGFAVVAPEGGAVTKFYPHPHSLHPARPGQPAGRRDRDGQLHQVARLGRPGTGGNADYVDDSHVIRLRRADGTGYFFMPFGLGATGADHRSRRAHGLAGRMEPSAPTRKAVGARRSCCGSTGSKSRCC